MTERKLLPTDLGKIAITSAAVDDAMVWSLLPIVIALVNNTGNGIVALYVLLATIAWALFLIFVVRPGFVWLVEAGSENDGISQLTIFLTFMLIFVSAWFTQAVGVHAIFGAFLAGLILPHEHGFAIKVTEKLEDLVSIVLLPLVTYNPNI